MGKLPIKLTNERRERVWHLLLKGYNANETKRILNISNATVHRDIKFLTTKSQEYMSDMAKGLHVLMYQKAIEGISLALTEAWNKFHDPKTDPRQRAFYLKLIGDVNEKIFNLTTNGPTVM